MDTIKSRLEFEGWVELSYYKGDLSFLMEELCSAYKFSIKDSKYKSLVPKLESETKYFSLSSAYGINQFPLHTDGISYSTPPRFLIMRALVDSRTATTIADAKTILDNSQMASSLWEFKTNNGRVCKSLVEKHTTYDKAIIRFNRLSMKCKTNEADLIIQYIDKLPITRVEWTKYKTLIIDNWRMVHGRESVVDQVYHKRKIERLQVFI